MADIKFNRFPDGCYKALTLSYDDGKEHDRRLVDILNRHKLRASFHLNSAHLDKAGYVRSDEISTLYKGHEVACHTVTHPRLPESSMDKIVSEITCNRRDLESLVGYPVRGFSYPCGGHNHDHRVAHILPALGMAYGRTLHNDREFRMPNDPYRWFPTCHHNDDLMGWSEKFRELKPGNEAKLLFVWGHSYEFANNDNWDLIETFASHVSMRDDIWYATVIEIADYIEAINRLVFDTAMTRVMNPCAQSVWISVNGEAVKVPGGSMVALE